MNVALAVIAFENFIFPTSRVLRVLTRAHLRPAYIDAAKNDVPKCITCFFPLDLILGNRRALLMYSPRVRVSAVASFYNLIYTRPRAAREGRKSLAALIPVYVRDIEFVCAYVRPASTVSFAPWTILKSKIHEFTRADIIYRVYIYIMLAWD